MTSHHFPAQLLALRSQGTSWKIRYYFSCNQRRAGFGANLQDSSAGHPESDLSTEVHIRSPKPRAQRLNVPHKSAHKIQVRGPPCTSRRGSPAGQTPGAPMGRGPCSPLRLAAPEHMDPRRGQVAQGEARGERRPELQEEASRADLHPTGTPSRLQRRPGLGPPNRRGPSAPSNPEVLPPRSLGPAHTPCDWLSHRAPPTPPPAGGHVTELRPMSCDGRSAHGPWEGFSFPVRMLWPRWTPSRTCCGAWGRVVPAIG